MIEVIHLTKKYGDHVAVSDLSFTVTPGQIYGFLGPNGAGKSTTMNMMTGCLAASEGTVRIDGFDIFEQPREAKKRIGYLPEIPPLYPDRTPSEYLAFVGRAKGIPSSALSAQIRLVMEETGILEMSDRLIKNLSKGYRQRVGIAQALLGDPEVILLDEPTVGLDPLQIVEIRDLIRKLGETRTVILSSHILSEVQTVCGKILMIARGKLIAFDTPENLEKEFIRQGTVIWTVEASDSDARDILSEIHGINSISLKKAENNLCYFELDTERDASICRDLYQASASKGFSVYDLHLQQSNLENIFIQLTLNAAQEVSKP